MEPQTRKTTTHPWNWHDASHVIKSQSALESPKVHFLWIRMDPNLPDQWSTSPNTKRKKGKKKIVTWHLLQGGRISLNMTSLKILTAVTLWASLVRDYNFIIYNISKRVLIRVSIILSIFLIPFPRRKIGVKYLIRVYYQGDVFYLLTLKQS